MKNFIKQYWFLAWLLVGLFLPLNTNATTVYNGGLELKMAIGNYQDGIIYGNAINPEWITGTVPNNSSWSWIPAANYGGNANYWFVRYMNLYFTSDTSFLVGKTYSLDLYIEHGSYITFTDVYGWGLISNRNIGYCNGSTQNDLSQCSIQWTPQNDTGGEHLILIFRPNISTSQFSLEIGSTAINNNNFVFWNRFGGEQGFRVNSITITEIQNSANPSQDFTDVINAMDSNTQAINDLNDTLSQKQDALNDSVDDLNDTMKDETGVSDSDLEDFFEGFHNSESRPLRDLLFLLLKPFELLVEHSSDSCSNYTFGNLYGTSLTMPCINLEDILGSGFYDILDYLCSFAILYALFKFVAKSFHGLLNLNDVFNDFLYDHLGGR